MRAVRVFRLLAFGVVFAVDRRPFFGHLARRQPEPETEEVRRDGVQVERTVRLMAVQKDGDAGNGDVGEHQGHQHNLPPAGFGQSVGQLLNQTIPQSGKESGIGRKH